jgi:hypothetical protein
MAQQVCIYPPIYRVDGEPKVLPTASWKVHTGDARYSLPTQAVAARAFKTPREKCNDRLFLANGTAPIRAFLVGGMQPRTLAQRIATDAAQILAC